MVSETPTTAAIIPTTTDQEGGLQLGRFIAGIKRNLLIVLGVTTLTASAAVLKAITATPVYKSGFELLTPPTTLETQIISTINEDALSNQSDILNVTVDETKLKILKSPRVLQPVLEEVQRQYPNVSYRQIFNNLSITPDKSGNTLLVEYSSENQEQVQYVLEVVAETYLRYSLEDRQNAIFRGIDFVDEQLPIARQRVEDLEGQLESLRQDANLIDPLVQGEQLSAQAARFNADQLDLRVQIKQAEDVYANLQQELSGDREFAATSILQESARYQALLDQLLAVDSELAEQLTLYLEGSPEIEVIEERRDNLQPLLTREGARVQQQLASYIEELRDRDQALAETVEALNQQIKDLSTTARQYGSIQRELDIASTNLNEFLTKREALRIDAAQRQTPWEVLTPASAPKASSASAKQNLVLGTILGLLIGSGIAILVDRLRGKIYTIKELKESAVGLPLLGSIPHEQLLEEGYSLADSFNQLSQLGFNVDFFDGNGADAEGQQAVSLPFLEAFRLLSTNIQLNSPDQKIKALAISSAIPNMGKSTITFHLAHAIAAAGRKVLIIDADLRRPSLHRLCHVSNQKGLSSYIAGEAEIEDVITHVAADANLFVLPAGPVPPDPIRILAAQRMKDLLAFVQENYDIFIFDTPPILGFADVLMVTTYTQGMLLAAALGEIKFSQLQMALDELSIAKVPVIGLVANGVREEGRAQYTYYQYYRDVDQGNGALEPALASPLGAKNRFAQKQGSWYKAPLASISKTLRIKR